ncbi:antibiotic biosynthesis monooxygenase [Solimonas fluminis]|uniref:Antibiotic biosynthesis monooxygenase n=1 Tax=Solimonas fluminis TaxID=2086571 RepID=A0A2S5TE73_9GAMM|nr:antibiotic biosynthesis monooxygenase [Solimonas fluminis]PPE73197.1 antibiotic biosynthesis monooxygenase [Solimonas fluminis]
MSASRSIHRIDKFVVPPEAVPVFVAQIQRIQKILRTLPGCLGQMVLTQAGGSGEFNVLTWVEWQSQDAIAAAQAVVQGMFAAEGFDPAAFSRSLGVRADLGFYERA